LLSKSIGRERIFTADEECNSHFDGQWFALCGIAAQRMPTATARAKM
jgi:hypothetical protein|tara:strand:+ start:770 stop:910 length:141 start_codon:yes stop_codon:yes gene_type:complete